METHKVTSAEWGYACNCIGPQRGQPVCPCRMRNVKIVDGRYIQTIDLGPVAPTLPETLHYPMGKPTLSFLEKRECGCPAGSSCGNVACPHLPKVTC